MGLKKEGKNVEEMEEEEEVGEDWCFECHEGGSLIVCDFKHCLKSYHAECTYEDKPSLDNDDPWFCRRHSCYECKKSSKYLCAGCPYSVCKRCINKINFARIREKGLCNHCLKLALLGEEGLDVDSDGESVDFNDLETEEGLFFDYWKKVVKVKEELTLKDLQSADIRIKKGGKIKSTYKLKDSDSEEEFNFTTELDDNVDVADDKDDDDDEVEELRPKFGVKRKRSNEKKPTMHQGQKNKIGIPKSKSEIVSWASDCLIDFLESVGEDTSKKYELHKIASVINRYVHENKLDHPEKPRKILCDEKLKCLFGKKIVEKNKLIDLLEPHFPEYLESSGGAEEEEEVETKCIPEQKEKKFKPSRKKNSDSIIHNKSEKKEEFVRAPQSCFAFIVPENIKRVYLKKSLIQEMLKESETFEGKIVGSFVRVKLELSAVSRRYAFQLLPVTGIKKTSKDENHSEIFLLVSTLTKDISINLLSDDNFSEEECESLRKKVKDGLIRRPTIVELEEKARTLHEDITKHWIVKELVTLQNRIDRANEKGWRREFFECSERQRLLQMPEEQSRLLRKIPNIIPDVADDEPKSNDNDVEDDETRKQNLEKTKVFEIPKTPGTNEKKMGISVSNGKENETSSDEKEERKPDHTAKLVEENKVLQNQTNDILQVAAEKKIGEIAFSPEENQNNDYSTETCFLEVMSQQSYHVAPQIQDNILFECEYFQ